MSNIRENKMKTLIADCVPIWNIFGVNHANTSAIGIRIMITARVPKSAELKVTFAFAKSPLWISMVRYRDMEVFNASITNVT